MIIVSTVAIATWTCISLDDVSPPSTQTVLAYQPVLGDYLSAYGLLAFQVTTKIRPINCTINHVLKICRSRLRAISGCILSGRALATRRDNIVQPDIRTLIL